MSAQVEHTTVLLDEAVAALVTDPDGFYVDGTFGRGGHATRILAALSERGRLMGIDKDPVACQVASEKFAEDNRFQIVRGSFAQLAEMVSAQHRLGEVQGCCWTWVSPLPNWMMHRGDSVFFAMGLWICVWIRIPASVRPTGWQPQKSKKLPGCCATTAKSALPGVWRKPLLPPAMSNQLPAPRGWLRLSLKPTLLGKGQTPGDPGFSGYPYFY